MGKAEAPLIGGWLLAPLSLSSVVKQQMPERGLGVRGIRVGVRTPWKPLSNARLAVWEVRASQLLPNETESRYKAKALGTGRKWKCNRTAVHQIFRISKKELLGNWLNIVWRKKKNKETLPSNTRHFIMVLLKANDWSGILKSYNQYIRLKSKYIRSWPNYSKRTPSHINLHNFFNELEIKPCC